MLFALVGVFLFSLSLPMTKWALESFNPYLTATSRPILASLLAIPLMLTAKVPALPRTLWKPMVFTTIGAAFAWPLLIALALNRTTSAHVAVIAAIMPLTTAIMAVIRTNEKVSWQFWLASATGTILLILFAISRGGAENGDLLADLLTIGAVLASSFCYVEGAELTKLMPGWQVISWVVILALPICIPASIVIWMKTNTGAPITGHAIFGIVMIGFSSMYLGFFAWYRGLSDAGTARGSQVQQLQAIMTLGWAALLLKEKVTPLMLLIALGVITSVLWALMSRRKPAAN